MKKKLHAFLILMTFFAGAIVAQTPTYFTTNTPAGANAFPFSSLTTRKVQWTIPANSLGSVGPGNNITVVYFQAGGNATQTYPIINIKLKTGTSAGLTGSGGLFETGMTTVFSGVNHVVTSTIGSWFSFTLTTPFLYNPNLPLLLEVEQNATSGSGPTVYQNAYTGPGNGRQWGDYNQASFTGSGASLLNFGIDVIPATPCTAAPISNTINPVSFTTCAGITNPNLTLAQTYSFGGITYQWQSSTVSPVGPFTSIPNSTMSSAPVPTLGVTTWFQLVATCTNITNGTTTLSPAAFNVAAGTVKTVPYIEDFESIQVNDRLPNCSWFALNLGTTVKTYTSSQTNNRIPRSGTKFGSFALPSNNNLVYSNGITMSPGITYSAAIWYATEYFGYNNWSSLTLLLGSSQSSTGLIPIATVAPAISGPYKLLSGVFTVPSSGDYYIAIRANGTSGSALYLSFDDFSVTIPCEGGGAINSPSVSLAAAATTICAGDQLNLTANGADEYLWDNGATSSAIVVAPDFNTTYTVTGTNTLTGCSQAQTQFIYVNPSPAVIAVSNKQQVCPGESAQLTAYFANSYAWSTGASSSMISVTPTITTLYSVAGNNTFGCSKTATVLLTVKPRPTITALSGSTDNESCIGDLVSLQGFGGVSYQWYSNSSSALLQGSMVNVVLNTSTTFTVVGTGTNNCTNMATVSQNVVACTGLQQFAHTIEGLKLFPNPSNGIFTVELTNGEIKSVEITDVSGRVVLVNTISKEKMQIDISSLANGVYYAKISANNSSEVIRIVKN